MYRKMVSLKYSWGTAVPQPLPVTGLFAYQTILSLEQMVQGWNIHPWIIRSWDCFLICSLDLSLSGPFTPVWMG